MVAYRTVVRLVFRYAPQVWSAVRTLQEAAELWNENKPELRSMSEQEADAAIRDWCNSQR